MNATTGLPHLGFGESAPRPPLPSPHPALPSPHFPIPLTRRAFGITLSGLAWSVAREMALGEPTSASAAAKPRSLIVLWMDGGPSQLETFDPHPGKKIGGPTSAIATSAKGIRVAKGLPRVAAQMESIALIRSLTSKEGDHERGRYYLKTGHRMNPTVIHPSLGAICASQIPNANCELPPYIAIQSDDRLSRGGYLGNEFDPFRINDPRDPLPDVDSPVPRDRRDRRLQDLSVVERAFSGRYPEQSKRTLHEATVARALRMMDSAQLKAFRIEEEPAAVRAEYGDSAFGRGCLAARRLVETGVRCVEVALSGWDLHVNNFEGTAELNKTLDPAFAALIADLKRRKLFDSTLVVWLGEFGRTPQINPLDGRDHWPVAFSVALAGAGIRSGIAIGETDPAGGEKPTDPIEVPDLYATILTAVGVNPTTTTNTSIGRPIKLSDGTPITRLLV